MKMHDPPHPGEVLRQLCLEPLNLTVTDAARSLGVSRKALSSILNGRAGSPAARGTIAGSAWDSARAILRSSDVVWTGHQRTPPLSLQRTAFSRKRRPTSWLQS
jgi:hypothetical protein